MAVIYPFVDCALLLAALLAARHPTFRREFSCLAVAGALSVLCAVITLLFRLHLSFQLSFLTVDLRRNLLLLHDLAEVTSIVIYCIGFFALARHVMSLPRKPNVL